MALPDLVVSNVHPSFITTPEGSPTQITFTVTVRNNSTGPYFGVRSFYISASAPPDSNYPTGFKLSSLAGITSMNALEEQTVQIGTFLVDEGNTLDNQFTFYVDKDIYNSVNDNLVPELNESNNTNTRRVCFYDADEAPMTCHNTATGNIFSNITHTASSNQATVNWSTVVPTDSFVYYKKVGDSVFVSTP